MTKFESVHADFRKALERFEEVLKEEKTEIVRDSAIKRFELVFDLSWKTVKAYLEEFHNAACFSPQSCFREAFGKGLIEYDEHWIVIAKIRNRSVHTYSEPLADEIYKELPEVLVYLQKLSSSIEKQVAQINKRRS